jgi:hypothetical protein
MNIFWEIYLNNVYIGTVPDSLKTIYVRSYLLMNNRSDLDSNDFVEYRFINKVKSSEIYGFNYDVNDWRALELS